MMKNNNLREVNLSHCDQITNNGIHFLTRLDLEMLWLTECTKISDGAIQTISEIQGLKQIGLAGCDLISDGALELLARLTSLVEINLVRCDKLSAEAIQKLKDALPNCQVRS